MDPIRFGQSMRALRRRKRWTQLRLADAVGVSRPVIGRITVSVRVLWHGEGLDRLLDASHADLTDRVLQLLRDCGWLTATEVPFNIRGDRGTVDILAFHEPTGSLLVIEIKSVVPDLQAMLGTLDRKARVAPELARENGWRVASVSRLLVLPDDRTARRRVDRHAATFQAVLPSRTAAVRRWLRSPTGSMAGILFLTDGHEAVTRHRVGAKRLGD